MGEKMNPKIEELAKDCGYKHKPLTSLDEVGDFEYFDLEQFAELITDECLNICSQELMRNKYQDQAPYAAIQNIIRGIIARFGDGPK